MKTALTILLDHKTALPVDAVLATVSDALREAFLTSDADLGDEVRRLCVRHTGTGDDVWVELDQ